MRHSTFENLFTVTMRRSHFLVVLCLAICTFDACHGHGRLIEPPSRSTAFRYGFPTPENYNDHELYCGGKGRQEKNGGKCGECGDAWDLPQPRPNEYGGKYGQGVVVRTYKPGADITLRIQLTASHRGLVVELILWSAANAQHWLKNYNIFLVHLFAGTLNSGYVIIWPQSKIVWTNICWNCIAERQVYHNRMI